MNLKSFFHSIVCTVALFGSMQASNSLIGKKAPQFIAQALFPDGTVKDLNLDELIKQGYKIVLYFYPWDSTPGCSKQAQIFSDNYSLFEKEKIMVIGVSCNSIAAHKRFQKKYNIPYILVSDSRLHRRIGKKYPGTVSFFCYKRKTFLIDEQGIVFKAFDKVTIESQIEDILKEFENHTK